MKAVVSLFSALALCAAFGAAAQKQKVPFDVPATSTKYTQQHAIDVGDMPGHQVRVFELQRQYGKDAPMIEGVRIKETWTRGHTDFTDLNGLGTAYTVYVMDNGDKMFTRASFIANSVGGGELKNMGAATITGGTGKLHNIRGLVRSETRSNPSAGMNSTKGEIEYWIEK